MKLGKQIKPWAAAMALAATMLSGCADITNQQTVNDPDAQVDPNEGFNRAMYHVNNAIDTVVLRPVAATYRFILPETPRNWVSNFVHNLESPVYFVNSVLEGDVNNTFAVFWRFVLNSTVGIGGALDVAGESGLKARDTDFGQTLAVWGVDSGSYLYVPIYGPGTMRDTFGRVVDLAFNPLFWVHPTWYGYAQAGVTIVDARSRNYRLIDDVNSTSIDPYATFRSGYLQKRTEEIRRAKKAASASRHKAMHEDESNAGKPADAGTGKTSN